MSKKWIIAIVVCAIVCVVACVGMGMLRWGEMVYRLSDGERGWSVGVAVYQLFGWDAEAYEDDFGQTRRLVDECEEGAVDCAETSVRLARHRGHFANGRLGYRGAPRFLAGLVCLGSLGLLIVPGVIIYRRWRSTRDATAVPDKSSDSGDTG